MCKQIFFTILVLLAQQLAGQTCLNPTACPAASVPYCDLTANDDQLWNESYWWDAGNQAHNLAETGVQAEFHFTDTCGGALTIYYLLFLDLDGDGTRETVVDSRDLPGANTVRYGNGPDAPYDDGTPRAFDERPLPAGQLYGFALETTQNGNEFTARLRWNTPYAPLTFVDPQLPYGNHLIRWTAEKPGGEQLVCEYALDVRDCKSPTAVCLNGLSVNIMPTGLITLWAADFLQYADDNASPSLLLQFGIRKAGQGAGFPEDAGGAPLGSVTFDCAELGTQPVELWVRDVAGNADYCETYVIVEDALGNCGNAATVQINLCARQWCSGAPIAGVGFQLNSDAPGWPAVTLFDESPGVPDGCFSLATSVPSGSNYTLTPVLDNDPLNGVTALDLVRISQHILGLQPLNPYALIAADVNKSNTVTGFDLIQIRNLLTGATPDFLNSASWRFIDAGFVIDNPLNPFATPFTEATNFSFTSDTSLQLDFFGIKIGDVDCSGAPGVSAAPESRGVAWLTLPDRALAAEETLVLPLCAGEAAEWLGFQFALQFDPERLAVEVAAPGELPNWDAGAVAQPQPGGRLNVVWFDAAPPPVAPGKPLFYLRFRALDALHLSEALSLSADRLPAEAYTAGAETRALQLAFVAPTTTVTSIAPPRPNPLPAGRDAVLTLHLAEPAWVEYAVTDLTGRILFVRRLLCEAGLQQLALPATAFPGAGVYGWRVQTSETTASGKVVRE